MRNCSASVDPELSQDTSSSIQSTARCMHFSHTVKQTLQYGEFSKNSFHHKGLKSSSMTHEEENNCNIHEMPKFTKVKLFSSSGSRVIPTYI